MFASLRSTWERIIHGRKTDQEIDRIWEREVARRQLERIKKSNK